MGSKLFKQKETNFEAARRKAIARWSDNVPVSEAPFYAARTRFRNVVGYEPLSYEEWLSVEDLKKLVALF